MSAVKHTHDLLLLDSSIRDWVVLPLLIIMIAAGLLRQFLSQYLRMKIKKVPKIECHVKSNLQRTSRLRCIGGGGAFLTQDKWEGRRGHTVIWLREQAEVVAEEAQQAADGDTNNNELPGMNPAAMMDGMKGGMAGMVQNMVMMQGISHFFKGYVLLKVPFSLTKGFKGMFQRGLDLMSLDTSYVSSVSWYFLVMYGLRGFFRLVMGETKQEELESAQLQASLGNAIGGGAQKTPFDGPKMYSQGADQMELLRYAGKVEDAEKRLLGSNFPKGKKKKSSHNPGDDIFGFGGSTSKKSSSNKNNVANVGLRQRKK